MAWTNFSKLLALLSPLCVLPANSMILHERRTVVPAGFVRQGIAPADEQITLQVALKSNNLAGLEKKLRLAATPGSSNFRQWLSKEEVKSFTQPSPETLAVFNDFASSNGLTPTAISPNGDWISIELPVSKANKLFDAEFELFTHPSLKAPIMRTLSVSLPPELVGHVDALHPTTAFIIPDAQAQLGYRTLGPAYHRIPNRGLDASCNSSDPTGIITPSCLQEMYKIPTTPATQEKNSLMITGYEDEWALTADLEQFLELLRPDISPPTTFDVLTLDNGTNPQVPIGLGTEGNLDIQYAAGIATGVPLQYLTVGGDFLTAVLHTTAFLEGMDDPPSVVTTSYAQVESNFGESLATKICNGWMALGARGVSVIFASGDGGVHGNHDSAVSCVNSTFAPAFPAACPYVTTVGGTQGFAPEKAANFSGGGFSYYFPTPDYQASQVSDYLSTLPADFAGKFNHKGRGFPDVALQAWNYQIVADGEVRVEGGTSAAAPTFAAMVSLINDRLLAAGKPVLGFLNPFIYSTASKAFTDVLEGHNSGYHCNTSSAAFDAAPGWDPLTGFGTPIFPELLAAALA
ncbi:family S53 protease-like protein [Favolaschia claudopus]|uniref:tripeptidyl-peptidase II n=1 Tax=Favolaschia claudopus TaxID=2862362 RepID=A0AAW0DMB3_9AGAR